MNRKTKPSFIERYIGGILKKRWIILSVLFISVVFSTVICKWIQIDFSFEKYFPYHDPYKLVYDDYKQYFADEDLVLSLFIESPGGFTANLLNQQKVVARILAELGVHNIMYPGNIKKYQLVRNQNGFLLQTQLLYDENIPITTDMVSEIQTEISDNPLYKDILYSPESKYFPVYATIPETMNNYKERKQLLDQLKLKLNEQQYKYILIGMPVLRSDSIDLMLKDQAIFISLGLLLGLIVLWICFKSFKDILISMFTIAPAIILIFACLAIFKVSFTTLFSVTPLVMLIIGMSDILHTLIRLKSIKKSRPDIQISQLIITTFSHTAKVCFLTSLTTAIAFLSLVFTNVIVIQQFSIITAAGVIILYLVFLHIFPVLLYFFYSKGSLKTWYLFQNISFFDKTAVWVIKRKRLIIAVTAILTGLFLLSFFFLEKNGYIKGDMKKSNPLYKAFNLIEEDFNSVFTLHVLINIPEDRDLYSYDVINKIGVFHQTAAGIPEISKVVSPASILEIISSKKEWNAGLAKTFQSIVNNSDPAIFDYFYKREAKKARMVFFIEDCGFKRLNEIVKTLEAEAAGLEPYNVELKMTGTILLVSRIYDMIVNNFLISFFLVVGIIFILLFIIFKSIPISLLALIPNFLPILFVLSFMSIFRIPVEPTNIIVFNIIFGIAIDDTLHLLYWIHHRLQVGDTIDQAVSSGFHFCSPAMLITTFVLTTGFALLIFSSFMTLYFLGTLSALALACALLCDLYVTPALACVAGNWVIRKKRKGSAT